MQCFAAWLLIFFFTVTTVAVFVKDLKLPKSKKKRNDLIFDLFFLGMEVFICTQLITWKMLF